MKRTILPLALLALILADAISRSAVPAGGLGALGTGMPGRALLYLLFMLALAVPSRLLGLALGERSRFQAARRARRAARQARRSPGLDLSAA
jgi:hypothetical protein